MCMQEGVKGRSRTSSSASSTSSMSPRDSSPVSTSGSSESDDANSSNSIRNNNSTGNYGSRRTLHTNNTNDNSNMTGTTVDTTTNRLALHLLSDPPQQHAPTTVQRSFYNKSPQQHQQEHKPAQQQQQHLKKHNSSSFTPCSFPKTNDQSNIDILQHVSFHVTAGTIVSGLVVAFALSFPFWLAPHAANETYHFAHWDYDDSISHFDNTVWTYGTDYFLALCMLLLIVVIPCSTSSSFSTVGWCTRGLLGSYMISVTAGGLAHQFFCTVESQNTTAFRLLWTVCVGAVAAASGFMGATATALLQIDVKNNITNTNNDNGDSVKDTSQPQKHQWSLATIPIPIVSVWFWLAFATSVTAMVAAGGFSFQRPACDIFIVGITQFPSTFYMMLVLYGFQTTTVTKRGASSWTSSTLLPTSLRVWGCLGFILNAPLLPIYPLLVQYTNWSLGFINTLLHTCLLVAWSLQGASLKCVGEIVMQNEMLTQDMNHPSSDATSHLKPSSFPVRRV